MDPSPRQRFGSRLGSTLAAAGASLALGLLTAHVPASAATLQGGVSTNQYPPLDPRNFPNEDPLKVKPQLMPAAQQGGTRTCTPPSPTWRLLAQDGNMCLYAAPVNPSGSPLKAKVVSISEAGGGTSGRCGPDPWDQTKAVCDGGAPTPKPPLPQGGWQYGPYRYNIDPATLPDGLKAGLADGSCRPDDLAAPAPHITCGSAPPAPQPTTRATPAWNRYTVPESSAKQILAAARGRCYQHDRNSVICQNGPPPTVSDGGGGTAPPYRLGTIDKWDAWNQALASAISDEFQKHTNGFRSQFGGDRVPLKIHVDYFVVGPSKWQYGGKVLDYHIEITKVTIDEIPRADYGLSRRQLGNLATSFQSAVVQSMYATQVSYQSRLRFPAAPKDGKYPKAGTFSNDPAAPELVYSDGPTLRY